MDIYNGIMDPLPSTKYVFLNEGALGFFPKEDLGFFKGFYVLYIQTSLHADVTCLSLFLL